MCLVKYVDTSSDGFTKAGTVSSRRALHVGGTIAGVVVSVLVILFLVALVAMVILKCRTKSRREEEVSRRGRDKRSLARGMSGLWVWQGVTDI